MKFVPILTVLLFGLSACGQTVDGAETVSLTPETQQIVAGNDTPDETSTDQIISAENVPYYMPIFDGWRGEFISFPLGFAPELDYDGHADVRFMPGMFSDGAVDYWSYTFLWWLDADVTFDPARLNSDIEAYFTGLANVVDANGGLQKHQAQAQFTTQTSNAQAFTGQAVVFDGFVAKDKIDLNIQVNEVLCEEYGKKAVFFTLSPQDRNTKLWEELETVRHGFACVKP
ncbi:MAG: hypothetical protein ABJG88_13110 [Litorimonas sp.]